MKTNQAKDLLEIPGPTYFRKQNSSSRGRNHKQNISQDRLTVIKELKVCEDM